MSSALVEEIAAMLFPVYGIVGDPLGLKLQSYLQSLGGYPGFTISYNSLRYPMYPNIRLGVTTFWMTSIEGSYPISPTDGHLDAILEDQSQPVPEPFRWTGEMRIANTPFRGTITYYSPSTIAAFTLRSEHTSLQGKSYGPSYDELIELLKGLQVLNGRDEVIRQYDGS